MDSKGIVLAKVRGIEIRASRSWVVIFVFVTVAMSLQFGETFPLWRGPKAFLAGLAASILLFGSVILHELSHCFAARLFGIRARSITLDFFGGLSWLSREAARPIEEFVVTLAGPLANVVLTVVFGLAALLLYTSSPEMSALAAQTAYLNAILAVFNLVPGYPLDGGRVLRATLWWMMGSYERATRMAALVGQGIAGLLIMLGLALVSLQGLGGVGIAIIGFYLYLRARASVTELDVRRALKGLTVASLWIRTLPQIARSATLGQLAGEMVPGAGENADPYYMVVEDGIIWGVVASSRVMQVDPSRWDVVTVGDVMTPIEGLEKLSYQTDILGALAAMNFSEVAELPVVEDNVVQGFVGRDALIRFVSSRLGATNG